LVNSLVFNIVYIEIIKFHANKSRYFSKFPAMVVMRTKTAETMVSVFVTFVGPDLTQVSQLGVPVMKIAVMDPGNQILGFHFAKTNAFYNVGERFVSRTFLSPKTLFLTSKPDRKKQVFQLPQFEKEY